MELDPQTVSSVWWKGALGGALKGIPQGLLLGVIGFGVLVVGTYALAAFGVTGLAATMMHGLGGFLFTEAGAASISAGIAAGSASGFSLAALSPIPFIALNTVLTIAGNFLTSGQSAVNAYKQDVEHRMNDARITAIESREQMLEEVVTPSRAVQKILAQGPRNKGSFAAAEAEREASAPASPTIH
jgi:hypothetical protein